MTVVKDGNKYRLMKGDIIIATFKKEAKAIEYKEFRERWYTDETE